MVKNRIRVLISAYACEPNKGSEPGVGWNWTLQMAKMDEVYVITRSNNRKVIETFLQKHPVEGRERGMGHQPEAGRDCSIHF